jgi:hypothetical protein
MRRARENVYGNACENVRENAHDNVLTTFFDFALFQLSHDRAGDSKCGL